MIEELQKILSESPHLLKPVYRQRVEAGAHPLTGHCYVACEVLYYLSEEELVPCRLRVFGGVHWYLRKVDGTVVDPTVDQFDVPPNYGEGRGGGFLTREPSKRARTVINMLKAKTDATRTLS